MSSKTLEERAVSCSRWLWMPGMLVLGTTTDYSPAGTQEVSGKFIVTSVADGKPYFNLEVIRDPVPDLSYPSVAGCILHMVRATWTGVPATTARHWSWFEPERRSKYSWSCSYSSGDGFYQSHGQSEVEALIAALEAADKKGNYI